MMVEANLEGLSPGMVNVAVVWPDDTVQALPRAFEISGSGPGKLVITGDIPAAVRPLRAYTLWVTCSNAGGSDIDLPVILVSSPDNRAMRLSTADPFKREPVWVLPIREQPPFTRLPAGASVRFPVHWMAEGVAHTLNRFQISEVIESDESVDWPTMKSQHNPPGVSSAAWDIIWSNYASQMGPTWRSVIRKLRQDAAYLAGLDNPTRDVTRLLELELAAASASTGLSGPLLRECDAFSTAAGQPVLAFVRLYNHPIFSRSETGIFGTGWTHNLDYRLTLVDGDTVQVRLPSRFLRLFHKSPKGAWQPERYDHGELEATQNGWNLKDAGRTMAFDAEGWLKSVSLSTGARLDLVYASGKLAEVLHSNGERLQLQYSEDLLSALIDHAGRTTTYT
ncbi:hypothetical protein EG834_13720, partial [bacterium]|nr:hypothetical protein [bacterium]